MDFRIMACRQEGEKGKKFKIIKEVKYKKPKGANCLHIRNGHLAFGETIFDKDFEMMDTNIGVIFFKKTKKSKFLKLPMGMKNEEVTVVFPDYKYPDSGSGHYYGMPVFEDIPILSLK